MGSNPVRDDAVVLAFCFTPNIENGLIKWLCCIIVCKLCFEWIGNFMYIDYVDNVYYLSNL